MGAKPIGADTGKVREEREGWRTGKTFVAEDGGAGVTEVCVYQLSGNDSVTEERLAWRM